MADQDAMVTLKLTKPEALALLNAAQTGLAVIEAMRLQRAGVEGRLTVHDARLEAVADELDLMQPAVPARRRPHQLHLLQRHEVGRSAGGIEIFFSGHRPFELWRLAQSPWTTG
jgi:hypothetical protein